MPEPTGATVYFTGLELENVRCFAGKQILDLTARNGCPARWTLILGENGVGKTTLLQSLAWMRFSPANEDPHLLEEPNSLLESLLRVGSSNELQISATVKKEHGLSAIDDDLLCESAALQTTVRLRFTSRRLSGPDPPTRPSEHETKGISEPLVVAYGAMRFKGTHNLAEERLRDPIASRLATLTELYDVEDILRDLDYASQTKGTTSKEHDHLEQFKRILARILPDDISPAAIRIFAPDVLERGQPEGVWIELFSGLVPLSALSLGLQTVLSWTADLAWRLMRNYPDSANPFEEPAIVLIDELDLHLHPKWQLRIIDELSAIFTRTQFIATSHSPLLVQVAEMANFVLLRKSGAGVEIVNEPEVARSWRVDQIHASELFDLSHPRAKRIQRLVARRDELLDTVHRTADEDQELERLRSEISALPTAEDPRDQEAMDLIRKAADLFAKQDLADKTTE